MEAPEKVYLYPSDRAGEEYEDEWGDKPWGKGCVEYIRTDVFIEKACEWIKYNTQNGGCLFDGWEEDFKNYMKGE